MWDPQRPYAQLLTPAAKSQKLLLRLQHKKFLAPDQIGRSRDTFALWQKLLAKNIPSVPWPQFADIVLFPADKYIALQLWPFANLDVLEEAYRIRYIDGYILIDGREKAPYLALQGQKLIVAGHLADRIGSKVWQWLALPLSSWQVQVVKASSDLDAAAALDLISFLRRYDGSPWSQGGAGAPPFADLARAFFHIWRAGGNVVSSSRLQQLALAEAAQWLSEQTRVIRCNDKGYVMQSQDEDMVQ